MACPQCEEPLSQEGALSCAVCRNTWKTVDGIPCFAASDYYWGEIPETEMIQVNDLAKEIGWRNAIDQKVAPAYPAIHDYMINEARADFRFVLPLNSHSKVLDVGAGFGTISFGLQPHCGWITAVELIAERAKFIETRRAQEKLDNMEVVIASALKLPFAPETFDFIVVNGYLEWVGLADPTVNPRTLQIQFLSQLHRLLKPGGTIYIGIENRFGYDNFLGAKDHSGLRYTSLMPRWMADLACRFYLKQPYRVSRVYHNYRTYTYGKGGYRHLLQESGFGDCQFFMPVPGYNRPVELISLDHPAPLRFYLNHAISPISRLGKIKKKLALWGASLGLTACLSPHFSIVARKEGPYA
ncbi:MAG: class I SAM-dependent methyltransferase [Nitrospirae bacterium]|nr:class I SAM-dependent methyltransferase [Candidatus Manganitrophaceae bacterium]